MSTIETASPVQSPRAEPPPERENPPVAPAQAVETEGGDEMPNNLRKPRLLTVIAVALLFVAVLAGLFVLGWTPHEQELARARADAAVASGDNALVAVTHPIEAVAAATITLPCDVRPNQETSIFPRASGYLRRLYVDIQDHVTKGQVLAEIDTPEVDAQLDQARASLTLAQADVTKAKADLALAQRTLDRFQNVRDLGNEVTRQELDEKRTARDQAAAAVDQAVAGVGEAQANVRRLEVEQSFEKVVAPFDGIITARNYDVGALLSTNATGAGRELFRLAQTTTLRVFVDVPQVYATQIKTGQPAYLEVRNFPGRTFTGKVVRTSGSLDPASRTMSFELHFPNPKGELYAGMYGDAKLEIANPWCALEVPVSAMLFNASGTQVVTVRDGRVHFQAVTVGRDLGNKLQILSGVNANDNIVVNPSEQLKENLQVQTVQAATAP